MATAATPRKTVSIYDYPEHLNPFHEDDHHNKIRFWTIGRKLTRSNSITFSSIKDLRNSWALRSFMKKGKKKESCTSNSKGSTPTEGEPSPIVYRKTGQYTSVSTLPAPPKPSIRSTLPAPERPDRYVYGGSVTPLPRSRFQERLRSPSHHELNHNPLRANGDSLTITPYLTRSDALGSRLSVESCNPFEEGPVAPVRASRRKKKRAPPPPPPVASNSILVTSTQLSGEVTEVNESKRNSDVELEALNIELKIVEDEDVKETKSDDKKVNGNSVEIDIAGESKSDLKEVVSKEEHANETMQTAISSTRNEADNTDDDDVTFPKVDIGKYRRNSSINEDDVRLRRNNEKDFTPLTNRSKSLNNNFHSNNNYFTYDINLNTQPLDYEMKDTNGNPQKVVCKLYDDIPRKQSIETISSTEKEFIEIDRATKELEREISKLNLALKEDDTMLNSTRLSVSDMAKKFNNPDLLSPNPIPKPKRTISTNSTKN